MMITTDTKEELEMTDKNKPLVWWEYKLAEDIYMLNSMMRHGWEFVCTRRHPDGHDEYLVRRTTSVKTEQED